MNAAKNPGCASETIHYIHNDLGASQSLLVWRLKNIFMATTRPDDRPVPPRDSDAPADDKAAQFKAGNLLLREIWPDRFPGNAAQSRGREATKRGGTAKRRLGILGRVALQMMQTPAVTIDLVKALCRGEPGRAFTIARHCRQAPVLPELVVSRQYGFFLICNPKVASRSIIAALMGVDRDAELIRDRSFREIYAQYPEMKNYYSFAFVRHPCHRALSLYSEMHFSPERYPAVQRRNKMEKRQYLFDRWYGLAEAGSFDDYCRWLNTPYGADKFADQHFRSQHLCIRLGCGRLPDFVGHFEDIQADLDRIAAHLGMPRLALPMLNTASGWTPTPDAWRAARPQLAAQLTARNKRLLAKRYAEDFKLFGYSP